MVKRRKFSLSGENDRRKKRRMQKSAINKRQESSNNQCSSGAPSYVQCDLPFIAANEQEISVAAQDVLISIIDMVALSDDKSYRIVPSPSSQNSTQTDEMSVAAQDALESIIHMVLLSEDRSYRILPNQLQNSSRMDASTSGSNQNISKRATKNLRTTIETDQTQTEKVNSLNDGAVDNNGLESEADSEESDTETGVLLACSQVSTPNLHGDQNDTDQNLPLAPPARPMPRSDIGGLTIQCRFCSAYHFHGEMTRNSHQTGNVASFSNCCLDGKVVLTPKTGPPPLLRQLFYGQHVLSNEFKEHIRQYNNALAFTSMVADAVNFTGRGPYSFNVHGQVYHYSGCLEPQQPSDSRFAQLYVLDSDMATDIRIEKYGSALCRDLMEELADEITRVSPFARSYKMMKQVADEDALRFPGFNREVVMVFDIDRSRNSRTHNIPVVNEIAAVFISPDGEVPANRGIVVRHRDNRIRRMPIISPFVDPLTYPLLFPHGDRGWHPGLLMNAPGTSKRKRVSMRSYYAYLAHYRTGSILHMAGKLFQQFLVDVFCKVEENELNFIRNNQKKLRMDSYLGLMDHINDEAVQRGARVGRRIILPSSFNGGLRNKTQHYQDSMSMVSKFGKPDFFLTFTCNPQWPEITENLLPGQKPHDRPDIVSRVFKLKLDELREDLVKKHVLGKILAHVGVIEFQKRGLPHAHLLLTLRPDHKLQTPEDIDAVVSAEIPSPVDDPECHNAVLKHLIHGPCGHDNPNCPCMVDGSCGKSFPKPLSDETIMNINGFAQYRRRNLYVGNIGGPNGMEVDDRWVVPYNRFLLLKYNAHINVEVCASIKCVKYLYKYIFKGHDAASLTLRSSEAGGDVLNYDEVQSYIETRYVGAPEASWRLFKYRLQEKSHAVIRLAVHCEGLQSIVFEEGEEEEAIAGASGKFTTLTAFFELNRKKEHSPLNPDDMTDPRNHLYNDIPHHFTFNRDTGWKPRQRSSNEIGRIHFVSPSDSERFHLRLLLLHVRGAVSFESLRTVNGICYASFKEAARALGLTDDDDEWDRALEEAGLKYSAPLLRQLFADLMIFCKPSEPIGLWTKHKHLLSEDYVFRGASEGEAEYFCYIDIRDRVDGKVDLGTLIPSPTPPPVVPPDFFDPPTLDPADLQKKADEMYASLNKDQKRIADAVLREAGSSLADRSEHRAFFVDGPGGSGKTYLYETLNYVLQASGKKVANVAWSGIAAQLLPDGMTAHSVFKLPVPVCPENFMPMINPNSAVAEKLLQTDVFVWDEAPMSLKHAVEGVDMILRDLTQCDVPFGGKLMIFGGDFRQIPPIVREKHKTAVVEGSLKRSYIWKLLKKFHLRVNMRALGASPEFRQFILDVGDGKVPLNDDGEIEIPEHIRSNGDLIRETFGENIGDLLPEQLAKRAILCPKNSQCSEINDEVLQMMPGEERRYYSVDTALCDPGEQQYSAEFLHSLTPSGLPRHELRLKTGCIVMLLRNLNLRKGLCNGTRLIVVALNQHTIECRKIGSEETVLIPRIDSIPCDTDMPFKLKRRQFPLRLCFAITIHKSQGQTFERIGVNLPTPLFSHGHLYVALSRCQHEDSLKVLTSNNHSTRNIVISELL